MYCTIIHDVNYLQVQIQGGPGGRGGVPPAEPEPAAQVRREGQRGRRRPRHLQGLFTFKSAVCLPFNHLFLYIKDKIWELNQISDEVAWDMLAASEYVNSIMTTLVRIHKRDHT